MIDHLINNYPELEVCRHDIVKTFELLKSTYESNGIILACGNGGSAADAEHMVGELMKTFNLKRPLPANIKDRLIKNHGNDGTYLAENLQSSLTAISLVSQTSLTTAIANDVSADLIFAQQVIGYGEKNDVLFAISTSGNSRNILNAIYTARSMDMKIIGLTGRKGGKMKAFSDVAICVPADDTPRIQELHMPVYHTLCAMLENHFFKA